MNKEIFSVIFSRLSLKNAQHIIRAYAAIPSGIAETHKDAAATALATAKNLRWLAEIFSLPYNLPTISSHVTGEKPEGYTSDDKVGIHRGTWEFFSRSPGQPKMERTTEAVRYLHFPAMASSIDPSKNALQLICILLHIYR